MSNHSLKPMPYVGVSGVISPEIQSHLESVAREADLFETGRLLALGVKAVHKTQYLDIENKYGPEWYPVGEEAFATALRPADDSNETIAVAQTYLDIDHVGDADYRRAFVDRIIKRGTPWLEAIQFDMLPWHKDTTMLTFLHDLKTDFDVTIFLQCHKAAMDDLGPKGLIRRLGHFANDVDYLLFDSSHGTGQRMDVAALDPFLETASSSSRLKTTALAVAGGLDAETIQRNMPDLLAKYPKLSWDAEGRLHPFNDQGKRPLDLVGTAAYLKASTEVIQAA